MIEIIVAISIFLCSVSIFWYASKVFIYPVKTTHTLLMSLLNTLLFCINLIIFAKEIPSIRMAAIYIALFLEFKLLFKSDKKITLFGVLCFGTVLFGFRNIIMSAMAMMSKLPLYIFLSETANINISLTINYVLMSVFLVLLYRFMPIQVVTCILSNKKSTSFGILILGTISLYMWINQYSYFTPDASNILNIFHLKVGITALIGFGLMLLYTNIFSGFLIRKKELQALENALQEEIGDIAVLEERENKDFLTGLYLRNVAEDAIDEYLKQNRIFNVIFLDVDGLKYANDKYGHNEGDFYLQKVAEIISNVFKDGVCSRFGGDEFVVVSRDNEEQSIYLKVNICAEYVKKLKSIYQKPYETSVSYGVVNIKSNSHYSIGQIIKLADDRMYAFKAKNKKQRR